MGTLGNIEIKNLSVSYGSRKVLQNINLTIEDNKTTCILGVSGCGKTTLLNSIGNLVSYTGEITPIPQKIAYVFQEPNLIGSLTAKENIEYVLFELPKYERALIANKVLEQVELLDAQHQYPHTLSGGQKNRVALARAFAYNSSLILMDEPFTGLDIALKSRIITLFNKLIVSSPKPVIYVTHSIDEALLLGDKICVMNPSGDIIDCITISEEKSKRSISSEDLSLTRRKLLETLIQF